VREVPTTQAATASGLHIALRIGVPVFVRTLSAPPRLQWALSSASGDTFTLSGRNLGSGSTHVVRLEAFIPQTREVVWRSEEAAYVLVNGGHDWIVRASRPLPDGQQVDLAARTDTGELHEIVIVSLH
jgi:hypothetical protein